MALVSRIRLVPAFVAASLVLPAGTAAQDGTGGSAAPEPAPPASAAGSTLSAGPQALLGRAGKVTGTVRRRYHGRRQHPQGHHHAHAPLHALRPPRCGAE